MTLSRDTLITTTDVWLSLSDASAIVHDPEFWRARATAEVLFPALQALVVRGELIQWQVVENGTYLVRCSLDESADFEAPSKADWCEVSTLRLPTGRLTLRTAHETAQAIPVFEVPAGTYEARLEWFVSEEWQHANVTSAVEYVPSAGPEGILLLRRAR